MGLSTVSTPREGNRKSLHEVGAQQSEELTDVTVDDDASVVVSIRLLGIHELWDSHDVLFVTPPAQSRVLARLTVTFIDGLAGADTVSLAILYTNHEDQPHPALKYLSITASQPPPPLDLHADHPAPFHDASRVGISPSLAHLESSIGSTPGDLIAGRTHLMCENCPGRT